MAYLDNVATGDASALNAGKLRRQDLLKEGQRIYSGAYKVSDAANRQMTDEATRQIGAGLEAQGQELGQMALAGGPRDYGRFQKLQRELSQEGIATGTAQAAAETERIAQHREMAEKQAFDAALERQQQLGWQKQQFYLSQAASLLGSAFENFAG